MTSHLIIGNAVRWRLFPMGSKFSTLCVATQNVIEIRETLLRENAFPTWNNLIEKTIISSTSKLILWFSGLCFCFTAASFTLSFVSSKSVDQISFVFWGLLFFFLHHTIILTQCGNCTAYWPICQSNSLRKLDLVLFDHFWKFR